MSEVIGFVTSLPFLVSVGLLILSLAILRYSILKSVKLYIETQITNHRIEVTLKRDENSLAISCQNVEDKVQEHVEKFSLIASDKSELSLERVNTDISLIKLEKYIQIPTLGSVRDGLAAKSAVSSTVGGVIQLSSVAAANSNGLFRATVNPTSLTKFGDGTFSTMVHGSHGIVQNAGYQAASASVFAPLIVFQVMSMVTGQYYLNGITKQLNSIDKKIDKLIQLHQVERLAKIRYSVNLIKRLYKIGHPNIEDMLSLKMMENETGIIHEEYIHQLSSLDLDNIKSSEKRMTSSKLEELLSKVNDASFDFNLNMAITTDEILHLITIIEIILNSRMSDQVENRAKRLGELLHEVESWDSKEFYRARFGDTSVADFYSTVIKKLEEIYDKAILGKDKVESAISEFEGKQAQLKENIGGKIQALEMGRKLIKQMSEPVEILYLSNSETGDRVLVKN